MYGHTKVQKRLENAVYKKEEISWLPTLPVFTINLINLLHQLDFFKKFKAKT